MEDRDIKKDKGNFLNKIRSGITEQAEGIAYGGKPLFFTVILTFVVMIVVCVAVFLVTLQGAEKVMVPNVVGKTLTNALLEMQQKELYPKIQLRYSDNMSDAGTILEQTPDAGSIVKAYRRITLTVSRGVAVDHIDDYTGKSINEVLPKLQTIFSDENSTITVAKPVYIKDDSPAGTILAQYPAGGTYITDKIRLQLIASSGDKDETAQVPDISGMRINTFLKSMADQKVIFDFTAHEALSSETPNTVTSQDKPGETVAAWSHVRAEWAIAASAAADNENKTVTGIFTAEIQKVPYPVSMTLESSSADGHTAIIASFNHDGGKVTVPYEVSKGTTLTLYAMGKELYSETE